MAAATAHHQILMVFDGVNNVVARKRINTQARQRRINADIAIAGPGIAVTVGYGSGKGEVAIAKVLQVVGRNGHLPAQIIFHGSAVAFSADLNGDRIARRGMDDTTA
ncbi:hypothetical protein CISEMA079M_15390 [Citrobacter sedlakii]